jgi:hypothetical protein
MTLPTCQSIIARILAALILIGTGLCLPAQAGPVADSQTMTGNPLSFTYDGSPGIHPEQQENKAFSGTTIPCIYDDTANICNYDEIAEFTVAPIKTIDPSKGSSIN